MNIIFGSVESHHAYTNSLYASAVMLGICQIETQPQLVSQGRNKAVLIA